MGDGGFKFYIAKFNIYYSENCKDLWTNKLNTHIIERILTINHYTSSKMYKMILLFMFIYFVYC